MGRDDRDRKNRKGRLVVKHLENVSRKGLDGFRDIVLELVRGRQGVYALFGDRRVYFAGLLGDLQGRLDMHLKDWKWDTFSAYLTTDGFGLRDFETLILKIATPEGNRQPGGFLQSQDLKPDFRRRAAAAQQKDLASILGEEEKPEEKEPGEKRKKPKPPRRKAKGKEVPPQPPLPEGKKVAPEPPAAEEKKEAGAKEKPGPAKARRRTRGKKNVLAPYAKRGFEVRFWYKGRLLKAMVEKDGSIAYGEKSFTSPSLAASEITGRTTNGWMVWKYERSPGEWVLLDELRRKK
jgi:hypothetical protein